MGIVGDRRRRRHRTFALAAGLGVLVAVVAGGGRDPSPPPPLPALPAPSRGDLALTVDATRHGDQVEVGLDLAVDRRGDVLTVRSWDDGTVVGERLAHGQVVLHLGLVSPYPDIPDDVYTHVAPQPRPPVLLMPGRTLEASVTFDGDGPHVDGFRPAGSADVRRLDEVRICVWAERDARTGATDPTVCADDEV